MSVFIRLTIEKMMIKMKNRSHGPDVNSPRSRHKVNISMVSWYDNGDAYMY